MCIGLAVLKLLSVNPKTEQIKKYVVNNEIQVSQYQQMKMNTEKDKDRMNSVVLGGNEGCGFQHMVLNVCQYLHVSENYGNICLRM